MSDCFGTGFESALVTAWHGRAETLETSANRSVMVQSGGGRFCATFDLQDFAKELRLCRIRKIVESRPFRLGRL